MPRTQLSDSKFKQLPELQAKCSSGDATAVESALCKALVEEMMDILTLEERHALFAALMSLAGLLAMLSLLGVVVFSIE